MTATELLFERSPLGMALLDHDARYTGVNDAFARMWDTPPERLVGRTPEEVHGAGATDVQENVRSTLRTGARITAMEVSAVVGEDVRRWILTCFAVGEGAALFLGDVTERRRTERWLVRQHARNALLATAARELDLAAGAPALAQRVAELAIPSLGDWAVVELAGDDGALRLSGAAGVDGHTAPVAVSVRDAVRIALRARGQVIGRLSLGAADPQRLGEDERMTARLLGEHAALALDGALLAARQTRVASELQAGLLPPVLPTVPELELAARYRAAGGRTDVGGDYYDAFAARSDWVLLIGDVAGKGPAAAAITGLARHTLRAAARYERDPADALLALNDAMLQQLGGQRHCTAALVRIHLGADGVRAEVRCAGHPPPLVLRAGGAVEPVGRPGHPLGILDSPTFRDEGVMLGSGDMLVLYTDGVTEAGGGEAGLGEEGLAAVVRDAAGLPPSVLLGRVEAAVAERGVARDDIAMLAARVR
jgi:serine phosphatase RsbU (regulator of sigma subunit)